MRNAGMPFFAEHDREQIHLCCRKINDSWKIHRKDIFGEWLQVATGRDAKESEYSPTAEWIDGEWHIGFITLNGEDNHSACLCKMAGGIVSEVMPSVSTGFVRSDFTVYGSGADSFVIDYGENKKNIIHCDGMDGLLRISYDPEARHNLLISSRYFGRMVSWIYNLRTRKLFDVEADGFSAYSCAFFKGKCFYTRQAGNDFDNLEFIEAKNFKITPIDDKILVSNWSCTTTQV